MKVIFKTNVDSYKTNCWPDNINTPPRIGETVLVVPAFIPYFNSKKLPIRMEVVNVIWGENSVICELWYNKIDMVSANISGKNLFE